MRLYVSVLLLMVTVNGEFDSKRSLLIAENSALTENNSLKKRAPALSPVSSPVNAGVEYADTKQQLADKSPSQRVYATPAPQLAKFSDLLAGQAPSYQAAIANQLFSPVSVYQPRTGSPTTYEVSAPVPSQLAYSEHLQQPNLQYNPQVFNSKLPAQSDISQQEVLSQSQQIFNQQSLQQAYQQQPAYQQTLQQAYQQPLQQPLQQAYQQPLQQAYQQPLQQAYQPFPQGIQAQAQPVTYNQIPPAQFSAQQYKQLENQPSLQALQYQQSPKAFYSDNQQNLLNGQYNLAPQQYYSEGQQQYQQQYSQEPAQNIQYIQPADAYRQEQPEQNRVLERQQLVAQNYQTQPQGPVSFTKFSQDQAQSIVHHPLYQQNVQQAPSQGSGHENLSYFRPGPQIQIQPQNQLQSYQPQAQYSKPSPGYKGQSAAAAPSFPAVQYFGKYAQSIFNKNQQ